jgi:hypothetical protein
VAVSVQALPNCRMTPLHGRPISKKAVRKNGGIVKARGPTQVGDYVLKVCMRMLQLGGTCVKV